MKKESQKQGFVQGAMILMIGTVTVKVVSMLFKIPVSNMLGGQDTPILPMPMRFLTCFRPLPRQVFR